MQFPIHIGLRRSRLLVVSLLLFHAMAAACIVALPWTWVWRSLLLAAIGVSAWHALQATEINGLRLAEHGELACLFADRERIAAVVLPDSTVFNQLIVLRMRIGDARRVVSLVLLPDSMSAEQFRLLRLWLRWRGESGAIETTAGKRKNTSESGGKGA